MYSKVFTLFSQPEIITVECQITKGLPSFTIIGLPSKLIQESRERIKAALDYLGITLPPRKIIVNLHPVDVNKEGNHFDLPIALSILKALNYLKIPEDLIVAGELSLNGEVLSVRSIISYLLNFINKSDNRFLVLPLKNKQDVSILREKIKNGIKFVSSLSDLFDFDKIDICNDFGDISYLSDDNSQLIDLFDSIRGQDYAKFALSVAVSNKHNVLMVGPPGTGKSILSKASLVLYPPPREEEFIDIAKIYNLAGYDFSYWIKFKYVRPYRNPHHTSSYASIVGGGKDSKLGEITLAHNGILFMDEFPEFHRNVIEALREPLENKKITVSRVNVKVEYPADFILISAMNPCLCGYYKTNIKECQCSLNSIQKYWSKISGPILDRIDIFIEVSNIDFSQVYSERKQDYLNYYNLIKNANDFRIQRKQQKLNSQLNIEEVNSYCFDRLNSKAKELIEDIYKKQKLSIRKFHKILKLSRTIADIDNSDNITESHILTAYRLSFNRYQNL